MNTKDSDLNTVKNLLAETSNKLNELAKKKKKLDKELAPNFRLYEFMHNNEMGVSKCLAFLLNPNASHGQGDLYLNSFIDVFFADRKKPIAKKRLLESQVTTEHRAIVICGV